MSFALLAGLAVILLGYTLIYKMLHLWGGTSVGYLDSLVKGCP